ncbi:hypothetical protein G9A89_020231 [Geosiphon pyriformis]|nr:hypothetical protein G9A89_020231 [Geosiphon pyriformis]
MDLKYGGLYHSWPFFITRLVVDKTMIPLAGVAIHHLVSLEKYVERIAKDFKYRTCHSGNTTPTEQKSFMRKFPDSPQGLLFQCSDRIIVIFSSPHSKNRSFQNSRHEHNEINYDMLYRGEGLLLSLQSAGSFIEFSITYSGPKAQTIEIFETLSSKDDVCNKAIVPSSARRFVTYPILWYHSFAPILWRRIEFSTEDHQNRCNRKMSQVLTWRLIKTLLLHNSISPIRRFKNLRCIDQCNSVFIPGFSNIPIIEIAEATVSES